MRRPYLIAFIALSLVSCDIATSQPLPIARVPAPISGMAVAQSPTSLSAPIAAPITSTTGMIVLIVDDGLYADQRHELAQASNDALMYVSAQFGNGLLRPVNVVYVNDVNCFLHGVAHTEERTVQVSTCNAFGVARTVSIMAHEFVHQLAQDRYGPAHLSADLILAEGVATWSAGAYWLGGASDFRGYVRGMGAQYPLTQSYEGLGVGAQNTLYYEWASFVEFLITTYGREKFDRVYVLGKGAPGSADYQGVYGVPIDVLENQWRGWLQ